MGKEFRYFHLYFQQILKEKHILFSNKVTIVVGWGHGGALIVFVVMRGVVKVVVAVSSVLADALAAHSMRTHATGDASKPRSLSVSLCVNIRCHCKLLLF